jgi:SAM-dependent methyltransferase
VNSTFEKKQRDYYNAIAAQYDRYKTNTYALQYRYEMYDRFLNGLDIDFDGMHVLDALSGGGESSGYFLARNCTVSGLDISDEQCRIYAERFPHSEIRCESITKSSYADGAFDFIVINGLHHTYPHLDLTMHELHRLLKPGGYLFLWEPVSKSVMDYFRKLWYRLDPRFFEDNEKSIDVKEIVKQYPFSRIKSVYGGHVAYLLVHSALQFRIPPALIKYYAPALMAFENNAGNIPRFFSCWVLALLQKVEG